MLCHYKKIMQLSKEEFMKLVTCTYTENATFYPHDCEEYKNYQAFYMFPDEEDKDRNIKEERTLIKFVLFYLTFYDVFVCELEAVIDKEVHYYTIIVK